MRQDQGTVFRFEPLTVEDMKDVVTRAVDHFKAMGITVNVEEAALAQLTVHAGGDARRAFTEMDRLTTRAAVGKRHPVRRARGRRASCPSWIIHLRIVAGRPDRRC